MYAKQTRYNSGNVIDLKLFYVEYLKSQNGIKDISLEQKTFGVENIIGITNSGIDL